VLRDEWGTQFRVAVCEKQILRSDHDDKLREKNSGEMNEREVYGD
jgi:hypothetical protein